MHPIGSTARRFPLLARPRPPCTALPARISALSALANSAARDDDPVAAAQVHNQAALIASDCGQPDLARTWCHRHARAHLHDRPYDARTARHALEPLINLARLYIRAGSGDAALDLLDNLDDAILKRTDTVIDGIPIPVAALTSTPARHAELSRWLWSVHLADGTRALTMTGRWHDAETQLGRRKGIGKRMLDGRQVAVVARITRGRHAEAHHLLSHTEPGEPWEDAVIACLTALARPAGEPLPVAHLDAMINRHRRVQPDPQLIVFRTRLALSIIDAIGDMDHPAAHNTASELICGVLESNDGYAGRDLLAHSGCTSFASTRQSEQLATVIHRSGLDRPLPGALSSQLEAALTACEASLR